jgi:hypothetical protein
MLNRQHHLHEESRLIAAVKVEFWYEVTVNEGRDNERTEIQIDYTRFIDFLHQNGFGLLCYAKQVEIIRVVNHVVSPTLEKGNLNLTIKQFVLWNLRQWCEENVLEVMLKRHSTFFSTAFLTALKPLDIRFYHDTPDRCCLFFTNGFVTVRREASEATPPKIPVTFQPYDQLQEYIWEALIQDHAYQGHYHPEPLKKPDQDAVFTSFLFYCAMEFNGKYGNDYDIVSADITNFMAFQYTFGYLVHNYKDRANVRAVICVDNDVSLGEANGRRGKSLFGEALKYLRKVTVEDGRNIKVENNQFAFQTVELDSNILLIDDVRSGFDFSALYNCITGDWSIERKRESRLLLGFEDAPKILITTNYAILGEGDSHQARWFILPFVRYFHAGYTPLHEFKQRFFLDWDEAEWQRFFDAVIECLRVYFKAEQPILADLATYRKHKLTASMPAEYLNYFEEHFDPEHFPVEVHKDDFFEGFRARYPMFEKLTRNKFTGYLKTYCKLNGFVINPGYDDGRCWRTNTDGQKYEALIITTPAGNTPPQP